MPRLSSIEDCVETKLVISDGVVMRCKLVDNSYVPMEMLDLIDVVKNIRKQLLGKEPLHPCVSAPSSPRRLGSTNASVPSAKGYLTEGEPRRNSFPADVLKQHVHALSRVGHSDRGKTNSVCLPMHSLSPKKAGSVSSMDGQPSAGKQQPICDLAREKLAAVLCAKPRSNSFSETPKQTQNGGCFGSSDSEESSAFIPRAADNGYESFQSNYSDSQSDVLSDSDCDYDSNSDGDSDSGEGGECAGEFCDMLMIQNQVDDVMSCLASSEDYVHVTRFNSISQLRRFLEACSKCKRSVALDVLADVNCSVSVVFQFLDDFKQDFMMLNLNKEYMLFLRPF